MQSTTVLKIYSNTVVGGSLNNVSEQWYYMFWCIFIVAGLSLFSASLGVSDTRTSSLHEGQLDPDGLAGWVYFSLGLEGVSGVSGSCIFSETKIVTAHYSSHPPGMYK